ncbi:DUF4855 domain-containing protein [Marinicrinis lubricantis]|uniref:DUF4855 domain-containing protein n=1 Tax=Marinicrinis lubricantis TaxID=2086470 RepID=A0ABW1IQU3_9BACL
MLKTSSEGYLSSQQDGFRNHLCVLPCGGVTDHAVTNWTADVLKYYASYIINGSPADWMFHGFIFTPVSVRKNRYIYPKYAAFGTLGDLTDWQEWLNQLFLPGQNLHALHEAAAGKALDLWMTVPYPFLHQQNFGVVGGKLLHFNTVEDRLAAVKWWIDQFLIRWNAAKHLSDRLIFRGFVWQRESVFDFDEKLVLETNLYIKSKGFHRMWLPFHGSYMCLKWDQLDFDAVVTQANLYGNSVNNMYWIESCANYAKHFHTGIQIIGGKGVLYKDTDLLDYFNFGLPDRSNYMKSAFLVYQFPGQTLKEMYENRIVDYIRLYTFIKGLYSKISYPGMPYV